MPDKEIILVGGGGHCRSCIDVIEESGQYKIAGIVERPGTDKSLKILGYSVIGYDTDLLKLRLKYDNAVITVGQIQSNRIRLSLFAQLKKLNFNLPVIISPVAHVSKNAFIDEGSFVMHHAIINAGATIGKNCIINSKCLIEHDVIVKDHSHISTAAVVNGDCVVGRNCFIGSNATIVNSCNVPDCSFVRADSLFSKESV